MARQGNRLAALQIGKLIKTPGDYADGLGLYLQVRRPGDASWRFRYKFNKRPSHLGLGPLRDVSLQEARARAAEARKLILSGKDPLAVKAAARAAAQIEAARTLTFEQAARQFLATETIQKLKDQDSWPRSLGYCFPIIGNLPLQQIDSAVVLNALLTIRKNNGAETATRTRSRIERIFSWAAAHQYFTGTNPASRDVLRDALPAKPKPVHHKALAYSQMPSLMAELRQRDSVSSLALQFTLLCASRTSETTGALWSEIDMAAKTWSISGDRMKAGRPHTVPLSDAALAILKALPRTGEHVFVNGGGLPLSNQAMSELLKGLRPGVTVHGTARSGFMTWAAECTGYPREVRDQALAHVVSDRVMAAYQRGTLLQKRIQLMAAWARYLEGQGVAGGEVVPIRA